MTPPARLLATFAAASLALFQAWLWFEGGIAVAAAALVVVAGALVAFALWPTSAFGRQMARIWAPPRRANETERRFRLRIAFLWLVVACAAYVSIRFLPAQEQSLEGELSDAYLSVPVLLFVLLALIMGVQSLLAAFTSADRRDAPN